jgi:hypothetical protein
MPYEAAQVGAPIERDDDSPILNASVTRAAGNVLHANERDELQEQEQEGQLY